MNQDPMASCQDIHFTHDADNNTITITTRLQGCVWQLDDPYLCSWQSKVEDQEWTMIHKLHSTPSEGDIVPIPNQSSDIQQRIDCEDICLEKPFRSDCCTRVPIHYCELQNSRNQHGVNAPANSAESDGDGEHVPYTDLTSWTRQIAGIVTRSNVRSDPWSTYSRSEDTCSGDSKRTSPRSPWQSPPAPSATPNKSTDFSTKS